MVRRVAAKVAWVGRTASMVLGLAVVLAMMLGVASVALAGTGVGAVFNLGATNTVDVVSKLVSHLGTGPAGPMLLIDNNSSASGATGLSIQTEAGKPPMKVNQAAKVANLNSDKLDGQDSTAFGVKRLVGPLALSDTCDGSTPINEWTECSKIQVTVPQGKTYQALIIAEGSFYEGDDSTQNRILFCPSARPSNKTTSPLADCVQQERGLIANTGEMESTSDMGVRTLTSGTWILSSAVKPSNDLDASGTFDYAKSQTEALIWDASAPAPQTQ